MAIQTSPQPRFIETQDVFATNTHQAQLLEIRDKKRKLWRAIILSSGTDVILNIFELPAAIQTLGASLIVDEILEYFISNWVAGTDIQIKKRNRLIGLIPIPGITSISVQCAKELWWLNREEKKLMKALGLPK
jgi:hypothetical protein